MATRKILLKSRVGVRLERIETLSAQGKVKAAHFVVKTTRANQPRVLSDETAAENAFDLEVIASLADPVCSRLAADD